MVDWITLPTQKNKTKTKTLSRIRYALCILKYNFGIDVAYKTSDYVFVFPSKAKNYTGCFFFFIIFIEILCFDMYAPIASPKLAHMYGWPFFQIQVTRIPFQDERRWYHSSKFYSFFLFSAPWIHLYSIPGSPDAGSTSSYTGVFPLGRMAPTTWTGIRTTCFFLRGIDA